MAIASAFNYFIHFILNQDGVNINELENLHADISILKENVQQWVLIMFIFMYVCMYVFM